MWVPFLCLDETTTFNKAFLNPLLQALYSEEHPDPNSEPNRQLFEHARRAADSASAINITIAPDNLLEVVGRPVLSAAGHVLLTRRLAGMSDTYLQVSPSLPHQVKNTAYDNCAFYYARLDRRQSSFCNHNASSGLLLEHLPVWYWL